MRHIGSGCSLHKQWGKYSTTTTGYDDISYPIAFTDAVFSVIPVDWDTSNITVSRGYTFTVLENDTAKEMNVQLNISARIYQVYLTDSSMPGNSAINVTMCWDRDMTNYIVSSFTVKATNPPSSFSWLFIGKSS